MAEIKIGDTVVLKSGGPPMTVASGVFGLPPSVTCQWFERDSVKKGTFPVETLKPANGRERNG